MSDQWVLWVLVAASGFHVMDEHAMGWQGWASGVLGEKFGIHPSWSDFWVTNAALIVFGIAASMIGWQAPAIALALPALLLINAFGFHIIPSLAADRPNPGLFTAVILYVPLSVWAYVAAFNDGVFCFWTVVGSIMIGAALMASAIGILMLAERLRYPDAQHPASRN